MFVKKLIFVYPCPYEYSSHTDSIYRIPTNRRGVYDSILSADYSSLYGQP